jgi:hypothetical protein
VNAARLALVVLFTGVVVAAGPAFAQGRSDSAPGQTKNDTTPPGQSQTKNDKSKGSTTSSSSSSGSSSSARTSLAAESGIASPTTSTLPTSAPAAAANAVVYYGSWLDDASAIEAGDLWVGLATGLWRGDGNRQIDAPVVSVAAGISQRFQAGGSLSFYHFRDVDGFAENGFGQVSFYGKFLLFDPAQTTSGFGLAVAPLVEITPGFDHPAGWALPLNLEWRRGRSRVYGSVGYFSRGSTFGTAAVEIPAGSRVSLTGTFGQSYAHVGTHQTSFSIGGHFYMTGTSGLFVGVGHTSMPSALGPGGVSLAGGMSFLLPDPVTH